MVPGTFLTVANGHICPELGCKSLLFMSSGDDNNRSSVSLGKKHRKGVNSATSPNDKHRLPRTKGSPGKEHSPYRCASQQKGGCHRVGNCLWNWNKTLGWYRYSLGEPTGAILSDNPIEGAFALFAPLRPFIPPEEIARYHRNSVPTIH
jgi:hypothetical protein